MKNDISTLYQLIDKFKSEIAIFKSHIEEREKNIEIIQNTLTLLKQEQTGITQSIGIATLDINKTEKYKGLKKNKAILDVLSSTDKYLTGVEIHDKLISGGFESNSSNFQRDIYIALNRLENDHKVISDKSGPRKSYTVAKDLIG